MSESEVQSVRQRKIRQGKARCLLLASCFSPVFPDVVSAAAACQDSLSLRLNNR